MTTPIDPSNPSADASPTEPVPAVPAFEPAPSPVPAATATAGPAVAPAPAPVKPRKSGVSILNVALGVAVLVATAGVAFAVGRTTAPAAASSQTAIEVPGGGRFFTNGGPNASFEPNDVQGGPGNGVGRIGLGAAPTVEGTVDSITADSITIKTADGNTITIGLDSSTTYHQQADATASDVQPGKTVKVQLAGGFRPGANGNGNGNGNGNNGNGNGNGNGSGSISLGSAGDVTVVP